jgi:hypothetical protein
MKKKLLLALLSISIVGISQNNKTANTTTVSCNLTYERTLQTFDVYIHNPTGATMYRAKMYIDADGSPRAYGPNNSGLDWTANAGYPGNWWALITDGSGNPILQGASDPYPGMYVCATSLADSRYAFSNPLRYVNSETVPYIAIPTNVLSSGNIIRGDVAYVYNTITGQSCFAIYADAGNTTSIGEASIMTASKVGVNPNVKTGGTSSGIIDYVVFPHSGFGQGYIPTVAQIDSMGNARLAAAGGTLITSCLSTPNDNIAPTSLISTTNVWDTTTFVATFTDDDNSGGSGVEKSFYQVSDYNGTEWRANAGRGFFHDDFNGPAIHPDWTSKTGIWSVATGSVLQQTDETNSNTNLFAALTQTIVSNRFLYNWTGTLSGSGTNRRAGFHFFCDAPDSTNRGNSYFAFFRLDNDRIQIYKVIDNSWGSGPVEDVALDFNANQAYDFKISYDRTTGSIKVYVDNVLSAEWIDPTPINTGTHISFRSANCNYKVDNFKVYRSRNSTASIFVGSASTNYIRFQNQNPTSPAGKIRTIVTDVSGNLSTVTTKTINVDWTNPSTISNLRDGIATDIDTTTNGTQLQANWGSAIDANSNISDYYYAIGTTPGASNVKAWTNIPSGSTTSITVTGLTLIQSQKYYISLQSENFATMRSTVLVTDGQVYYNNVATSVKNIDNKLDLNIFPNPNNGQFEIRYSSLSSLKTEIKILDVLGKVVYQTELTNNKSLIDLNTQAAGIYYVILTNENNQITKKIIVVK